MRNHDRSVVDVLQALDAMTWSRHPGATEHSIRGVERRFNIRLPADYRELLRHFDGGGLTGRGTSVNFAPIAGLIEHNIDPRFRDHLQGMFVIGDDGEGAVYFLDPSGALGYGGNTIFHVPLGDLKIANSRFAAANVSDLVKGSLRGEDIYSRPKLSKQR
jgi:SMI1/KNR4 family protein SUKH-1